MREYGKYRIFRGLLFKEFDMMEGLMLGVFEECGFIIMVLGSFIRLE